MTDIINEVRAALDIAIALGQAIRELTMLNGGVPSGELYARVQGHLHIDTYNAAIRLLEDQRLITTDNHFLVWRG